MACGTYSPWWMAAGDVGCGDQYYPTPVMLLFLLLLLFWLVVVIVLHWVVIRGESMMVAVVRVVPVISLIALPGICWWHNADRTLLCAFPTNTDVWFIVVCFYDNCFHRVIGRSYHRTRGVPGRSPWLLFFFNVTRGVVIALHWIAVSGESTMVAAVPVALRPTTDVGAVPIAIPSCGH